MKNNIINDTIISIVLFHHRQEHLQQIISSILSSGIKKLVLIDNGGCKWASKLDSSIDYILPHKNIGYGAAHNLAIRKWAHTAKYYIVCNPDIHLEESQLKKLLLAAEANNAGLYMPNIIYPNKERQELCKLLPTPINLLARRFIPLLANSLNCKYLLRDADYSQSFFVPSLSGCFMLFKSEALLDIGGFDERYFMYLEDIDLSRRIAKKYGAMYIHNATVVHEFQKGSYKDTSLLMSHITSAIKYFNKWGWVFDKERRELNRKCLAELPRYQTSQSSKAQQE